MQRLRGAPPADLAGFAATVTDITDRSDLAEAHAEAVYSAPTSSPAKYHPVVIRNRRVAAVAGGLLLIFLVFIAVRLLTPAKPLTAAAYLRYLESKYLETP